MPTTNTAGCDRNNTCTYNWYTTPTTFTEGPSSANPCPARKSWYDFDRKSCVDGLGNPILINTFNNCTSNTVYSLRDNACTNVRTAFATQPANTVGSPSLTTPGEFGNCKTPDQGDCTPYYLNNGQMTTTNPCGTGFNYNFPNKNCIAKNNPCCGKTPSVLATDPTCPNLVQSNVDYVRNSTPIPANRTALCANKTTMLASLRAAAPTNTLCSLYWTKTTSNTYNNAYTTLCQTAGFQDYYNNFDTMAAF
jgi:hypothetical protein